jgi:hypothetical protein
MTPSRENEFTLSTLLDISDRYIDVALEHQRMSLSVGQLPIIESIAMWPDPPFGQKATFREADFSGLGTAEILTDLQVAYLFRRDGEVRANSGRTDRSGDGTRAVLPYRADSEEMVVGGDFL